MVQECAILLALTVAFDVVPYLDGLGAFCSEICASQPGFSIDDMRHHVRSSFTNIECPVPELGSSSLEAIASKL